MGQDHTVVIMTIMTGQSGPQCIGWKRCPMSLTTIVGETTTGLMDMITTIGQSGLQCIGWKSSPMNLIIMVGVVITGVADLVGVMAQAGVVLALMVLLLVMVLCLMVQGLGFKHHQWHPTKFQSRCLLKRAKQRQRLWLLQR